MFHIHRAQALVAEVTAISEAMALIAAEQRAGILAHPGDQLARLDVVVTGIMRTQTQLVATVNILTTTLLEFLLDEERERGPGLNE